MNENSSSSLKLLISLKEKHVVFIKAVINSSKTLLINKFYPIIISMISYRNDQS